MKRALRVIHWAALTYAALAMGVATIAWFRAHHFVEVSAREVMNLLGLVAGVGLCCVVLWVSRPSKGASLRGMILLQVLLIIVLGWYWFSLYPVTGNELHTFDAGKYPRDLLQQAALSIGVFLFWIGLLSIGLGLKAWEERQQ